MKIKTEKILDFLFAIWVISTIVMPTSIVGKITTLILVVLIIVLLGIKKTRLTKFSTLDFLFFTFTIMQYILGIAIYKSSSLETSFTILYNLFFSAAIISYLMNKKDLAEFSEIYAKSTFFSLFILFIIYGINSKSMRFNTNIPIYFIGGHSSTSLAIMAAIPCYFLILLGKKENNKKNIILSLLLFILSLLTGTRKTIIIFGVSFLIILPLKNKHINFIKLLKICIYTSVALVISTFLLMKVPFLYNIVGNRFEGAIMSINVSTERITDDSIRVRERMSDRANYLISKKRYTGWGMDYFRASTQNELGYYTHNNFYEILIGGGIIGFTIYYLKYLVLGISILKIRCKDKNMSLFLFLFFIAMIIIELWQVTYIYRFILIYQSILIAIIYSYKNKTRKVSEKKIT